MVDAEKIKLDILSVLRTKGPSIPVNIATEIKTTILFASAFLSELVSEKKVGMSSMRVGSSPVYFLPGQEARLESFSAHLKSKEKEAFSLLKEKGFLVDSAQQPAIRVALRGIRDFAIPFKSQDNIVWRYFLVPEAEYKAKEPEIIEEIKKEEPIKVEIKEPEKEAIKEIPAGTQKKQREKKKVIRRAKSQQKEELFSRVKGFLSEKGMELKDVMGFTKNEILLKISDNGAEKILVAYNKRKITDNEIIKAHKKVSGLGLPYMVLGLSEPAKKTSDLVAAMKNLSSIHGLK